MKRKIVYTDAPPEVDEAIDYAVKHNLFLTKQQFLDLMEKSKNTATTPKPRRSNLKKVAAML